MRKRASKRRLVAVVGGVVLAGLALSRPVGAQSYDCGDTLALRSPDALEVKFVESPVVGNQLWWPHLDPAESGCMRLDIDSDLQNRMGVALLGDYVNLYDRQIDFTASESGEVGSQSARSVEISVTSAPANPAAASFGTTINVSGAGGAFLVDLVGDSAQQSNEGLPEFLPTTDITALGVTQLSGGGERIYAAVTGLPLVRSDDGGQTWIEPLLGEDSPIRDAALGLVVSPNNPDTVFLGTRRNGLIRSDDAGQTWGAADEDVRPPGIAARVSLLKYVQVEVGGQMIDRLYLVLRGVGFYFSDDDGATWEEIDRPQVPIIAGGQVNCQITQDTRYEDGEVQAVAVSPRDHRTLYVGVRRWGVYKGDVDHSSWTDAYDGLVQCAGGGDPGQTASVSYLAVHPQANGGEDVVFAATEFHGVFVSTNGASSWSDISQTVAYPVDEAGIPREISCMDVDPSQAEGVVVGFANAGLWRWSTMLGDWVQFDGGGGLSNGWIGSIAAMPTAGRFVVGTTGGGVYEQGDVIDLDRSLRSQGVTLGISLRFDAAGSIQTGEKWSIFGQTFQAYAVWRALDTNKVTGEPLWQMIGLFDLTNPEFCSVDPCDSPNQQHLPECFADKRANCFSIRVQNNQLQWGFFDSDVFNGFTYYYAISSLDYGFSGNTAPGSFNGDFVFSPRHPAESSDQARQFLSVKPDNYDFRVFQTNVDPRATLGNVYAVPNPLQRRGSWDIGTDESTIRFRNVSDTAHVQIFTLAGDLVRELDNVNTEGVERGNIQWDTRNAEGNQVASGVYIYRVTDATGAEFVSKVTIIR